MTPMRQGRDNESIDISNDLLHRFALLRRRSWELRFQITGFNRCQDRQGVDLVKILCNPIDEFMPEATKLFLAHVTQSRGQCCLGRFRLTHGCVSYTDLQLRTASRESPEGTEVNSRGRAALRDAHGHIHRNCKTLKGSNIRYRV